MSDNKPRLTIDARLFLAFAGIVHRATGVRPNDSLRGAAYSNSVYDHRHEFINSFPGGIAVAGKRVLDLGCGMGGETVGYAEDGAANVVGVDIEDARIQQSRKFAAEKVPGKPIGFRLLTGPGLPFPDGSFDIITMHDVVEHLEDPLAVFGECRRVLAPGGRICLSFGPLWFSPFGGHIHFFVQIPWAHLWVPERTIFNARSKYRSDGARTFAEAGIFKMSVRKFRRVLAQCGMKATHLELHASRGLKPLLKIPVLRELFCREIVCVLDT